MRRVPVSAATDCASIQLLPGLQGRRGLPYREHSFLTHPWLSRRLRESRTEVRFRSDAPSAAAPGLVELPRGATDAEVLAALGPGTVAAGSAVIMLSEAEDVLGGFEDAATGAYNEAPLSVFNCTSGDTVRLRFIHAGHLFSFRVSVRVGQG